MSEQEHEHEHAEVAQVPAIDPATFDLDAWIDGAQRTERSAVVYARPDLLAEIDHLDRQIESSRRAGPDDRGLDDPTPESLREKRDQLVAAFHASALEVRVRGLTRDEMNDREDAAKKDGVTGTDVDLYVLASAIVSPRFTLAQLKRMLERVGDSQINSIVQAYHRASAERPAVDVPSSPAASPRRGGRTS
jgi:hypothetical protein